MGLDASTLLGTLQVVGMQVCPPGTYKTIVSHMRGSPSIAVGSRVLGYMLRKKLAAEETAASQADTPEIGPRAFVALTAEELALISVDVRRRVRLVDVISKVARNQVGSAELRSGGFPGASMPLTITLQDGRRWLFEVPWLKRGAARKLVAELAA